MFAGLDFGGVGRFTDLRSRLADAVAQQVQQQSRAPFDQHAAQFGQCQVVVDRDALLCVDAPGVEPLFYGHHIDAGLAITGEDRPFDRCRPSPAGQQREVEVHHGQTIEHVREEKIDALADQMLQTQFRMAQEMGLEPKLGSMAPAGGDSGQSSLETLVRQIIALPTEEFLPLLHDMFRKEYEANKHKAPRVLPRVIEGHAGHVAPENGQAAG